MDDKCIIVTKVTTEDNSGWSTEEDRGKTFVATMATSADIIPETDCYQRKREITKISGIRGGYWEDILGGDEGE